MITSLILDPLHVDKTVFNTQNSVLINKPLNSELIILFHLLQQLGQGKVTTLLDLQPQTPQYRFILPFIILRIAST